MNLGDRRKAIFLENEDRHFFLKTLAEACAKKWQVHACCLMSNHFHLVIETPTANLVGAGMKWLMETRLTYWLNVVTPMFNAPAPLM